MKMQDKRERFLVEAMGGTYRHCMDHYIVTAQGIWSEGEYFYKLIKWAQKEKWWGHIKHELIADKVEGKGPLYWPINEAYLDAEALADAIHLYLLVKGPEWKPSKIGG